MTRNNPHFERRHFNWIAEVICNHPCDMNACDPGLERAAIARQFARSLRSTNPNFNERRFLEACGVKED